MATIINYTINYNITDVATNKGVDGLLVEVCDNITGNPLNSQSLSTNGAYKLAFSLEKGRNVSLYFNIYKEGLLLKSTIDYLINFVADNTNTTISQTYKLPKIGKISGKVVDSIGNPKVDYIIKVYNKLFLETTIISTTKTDAYGNFKIYYLRELPVYNIYAELHRDTFIASSELKTNARADIKFNFLTENKSFTGATQFEKLNSKSKSSLSKAKSISEITNDDIKVLSKSKRLNEQNLKYLCRAQQIVSKYEINEIDLPVEIIYALMKMGISVEPANLLMESKNNLRSTLEKSIEKNIIYIKPEEKEILINKYIEVIKYQALKIAVSNTTAKFSINNIFSGATIDEIKKQNVLSLYIQNENSDETFWNNVSSLNIETSSVKIIRANIELSRFSDFNVEVFKKLNSELLNYDKENPSFKALIQKGINFYEIANDTFVPIPEFIEGETDAIKRINYAKYLIRKSELLYPSQIISNVLFNKSVDLKTFFIKNSSFDFFKTSIESKNLVFTGISDPESVKNELKIHQRIANILPSEDKANSMKFLYDKKFYSALDVIKLNKEKFIEIAKQQGLIKQKAIEIYKKAEKRNTEILLAYAVYNLNSNSINTSVLPKLTYSSEKDYSIDLENIFGSSDYCTCHDSKSILSPAAYLVDNLNFLKNIEIEGNSNLYLKLIERRPDIKNIVLNINNTETTLPYIDIVNEVLSNAISSRLLYTNYQTDLTSNEILANPEHTNKTAFETLKNKINPLKLPFNLAHKESVAFLNQIDIKFYELIEKLPLSETNEPNKQKIYSAEYLGLTKEELDLIISNPPLYIKNKTTNELIKFSNDSGKIYITDFLEKTNLSFDELTEILKSSFVNKSRKQIIFETTCSITNATILFSDLEAYNLLNYKRLLNVTNWTVKELDDTLKKFNLESTDNVNFTTIEGRITLYAVRVIAAIQKLKEITNLNTETLLTWWTPIIINSDFDNNQIFDKVFLNKRVLNNEDETFSLTDGELTKSNDLLSKYIPEISATTKLSEKDITASFDVSTAKFSISSLSKAYALKTFTQAFDISIEEYRKICELTGLKAISEDYLQQNFSPFDTLNFIETFKKIKASGFSIFDIEYLIFDKRNESELIYSQDDFKIFLEEFKNYLTETLNNAITNKDYVVLLKDVLKYYYDLNNLESYDSDIKNIIDLINFPYSETIDTIVKYNLIFPNTNLAKKYLYYKIDESQNQTNANNTADTSQTNENNLVVPNDRAKFILFGNKDFASDENETIILGFTDTFNVFILLDEIKNYFSLEFNVSLDFINSLISDSEIENIINKLNNNNIDDSILNIYHKLYKLLLIINKYKIQEKHLDYIIKNNNLFDITYNNHFNSNLTSKSQIFLTFLNLHIACFLQNNYFANNKKSVFEFLVSDYSTSEKTVSVIEEISSVLNYDSDYFKDLVSIYIISDYKNPDWLFNAIDAFKLIKKLNVPTTKVLDWINLPFTEEGYNLQFAYSEQIKNTIKSLYTNDQWELIATPLQNNLREKLRDALCAYLISEGYTDGLNITKFKDNNDIYSFFLFDVEVSAKNMTSRVVLTHSILQLFVMRLQLGLEANINILESYKEKFKEWDWRKKYRVWEANRKVFLYPENWLEPELRPMKSEIFEELENELSQGDLNSELAEGALINYLTSLDKIAKLEIVQYIKDDNDKLHVIARTYDTPHIYYYRYKDESDLWVPWSKIDVEIEGNLIRPLIHNNIIYLFWPVFEKSQETDRIIFKIAFTKFTNNKWHSKKISDEAYTLYNSGEWFELICGQSNKTSVFNNIYYEFCYNQIVDQNKYEFYLMQPTCPSTGTSSIEISNKYEAFNKFKYSHFFYVFVFDFDNDFFKKEVNTDSLKTLQYHHNNKIGIIKNWGFRKYNNISPQFDIFEVTEKKVSDSKLISWTSNNQINLLDKAQDIKVTTSSKHNHNKFKDGFFIEDNNRIYFVSEHPELQLVSENNIDVVIDKSVSVNTKIDSNSLIPVLKENISELASNLDFSNSSYSYYTDLKSGGYYLPENQQSTILKSSIPVNNSYPVNFFENKYRFSSFYHPFSKRFLADIYSNGVKGFLTLDETKISSSFSFEDTYSPKTEVSSYHPSEKVEFDYSEAYSIYNWEIFFHIPIMTAVKLSQNQRFEEAQKWFHYIFDPTVPGTEANRFWRILPFVNVNQNFSVYELLTNINKYSKQIERWLANPFNPHLIASMRTIAYMKNVLMKYLDNLIAWGDMLFTRDTTENINEATQIYILAAQILGRRPVRISNIVNSSINVDEALSNNDIFGNSTVYNQIENLFTNPASSGKFDNINLRVKESLELITDQTEDNSYSLYQLSGIQSIMSKYFCIPENKKMLTYWDTVADRLFKIRHSQTIDGVERQLALFEPPIDPALLINAIANGVNVSDAINNLTSSNPIYKYRFLVQKALELTNDVKSLGQSLLSAIEKKDAEKLSLIRANHEANLLKAMTAIKEKAIEEQNQNISSLNQSVSNIKFRKNFYKNRIGNIQNKIDQVLGKDFDFQVKSILSSNEIAQIDNLNAANKLQISAQLVNILGSVLAVCPQIKIEGPFPPTISAEFGGIHLANIQSAISNSISLLASIKNHHATINSIMAGYERRQEEWNFQVDSTDGETKQIEKQILAAQIRKAMTEKELENHQIQIENSLEAKDFMESKFTNVELYDWMVREISSIYNASYKMAYNMAKQAELAFKTELGNDKINLIKSDNSSSLKQGLLAGEKLNNQLRQLEQLYIEQNKREYELTKQISLAQVNPFALLELKTEGNCEFEIPEILFDLDHPGHYFRRIKSVTFTIPSVAGPYTNINVKATLLNSKIRKNTDGINDTEFALLGENYAIIDYIPKSIATSSARNDSGMFEVNFNDERYLPFEGRGVVSSWKLEFPSELRQFDFNTISDVIMTINYTAREGGIQKYVNNYINKQIINLSNALATNGANLERVVSLKTEFPNNFYEFINNFEIIEVTPATTPVTTINIHSTIFELTDEHFSYFIKTKSLNIAKDNQEKLIPPMIYIIRSDKDSNPVIELIDNNFISKTLISSETKVTTKWVLENIKNISAYINNIEDIILVFNYTISE